MSSAAHSDFKATSLSDGDLLNLLAEKYGFSVEVERLELSQKCGSDLLVLNGKTPIKVDDEDREFVLSHRWTVKSKKRWDRTNVEVLMQEGGNARSLSNILSNASEGDLVTFKNGDETDFRKANLVLSTKRIVRKRPGCASQYKGVYFQKTSGRWFSRIMLNGKSRHLGYHGDEKRAALEYDKAARRLFGAAARLNFPREGERPALDYD